MDDLVKRFDAVEDRDLMICASRGVAYQRDMSTPVSYGDAYFDAYVKLEDQEIARKINIGRVDLVNSHAGVGAHVIDVGIGSGEFIKKRPNTFGYDVNPKAKEWLKEHNLLAPPFNHCKAFTFWDVLEHVENPDIYFRGMQTGSFLFTCLPVFSDLTKIRQSRHYKPNEHFYYWTEQGFVDWLALYRFRLLEKRDFETAAGRDNITSFAFVRDLPGYHDTLAQYQKLHMNFYGASAHLYFERIASEVMQLDPTSILDFGCGRTDLAAHFWKDGGRRIAKYDPAIPQYKDMPEGPFELVLCTDVMEHIPMTEVGMVFEEIKAKSKNVIFTISTKPARAKLPDGRNAHVTLLNPDEWTRWVKQAFRKAVRIPTAWDHIVMIKTFG